MDVIERYIQAAKEYAKTKRTQDKLEFERDLLLSLNGAVDITELDFIQLLHICLNTPLKHLEVFGWGQVERLRQAIHDKYLLDIDYTDRPIVQESFSAWLNLDTRELTASRPAWLSLYGSPPRSIFVKDCRILSNFSWRSVCAEGETESRQAARREQGPQEQPSLQAPFSADCV